MPAAILEGTHSSLFNKINFNVALWNYRLYIRVWKISTNDILYAVQLMQYFIAKKIRPQIEEVDLLIIIIHDHIDIKLLANYFELDSLCTWAILRDTDPIIVKVTSAAQTNLWTFNFHIR